jgi:hypothetical protein
MSKTLQKQSTPWIEERQLRQRQVKSLPGKENNHFLLLPRKASPFESILSREMKFRRIVVTKKIVKEKDNASRYFDTSLNSQPIVSIIPRRLPKDLQEQQNLLESHKEDDEGAKAKTEEEGKRKREERVLREFADVKTPDCGISSKKDGKKGATTSSDCDNVNMPTYFKFSS